MQHCHRRHYESAFLLIRQHGPQVADFLQAKMEMLLLQQLQEPGYAPIVDEWKCIEEAVRQSLAGDGIGN